MASEEVRQLIQLIDYIGVDYQEAVAGGRVVNSGEYAEMQDFAAAVVEGLARVSGPGERHALLGQGRRLHELIAQRADAGQVSALTAELRERLEALLVVAALAALLIKTQRRDGLAYLYGGLAGALLVGGLTWLAAATLIDIGGAQRELTEALVAAGVLFYVGFWLHSKTSALQWRRFIEGSVRKALGRGTLWGLAALAFIAVYREVFDTVLFYQALWMQTEPVGQGFIVSGLVGAAAVLAWLILRDSTRLPLRQFFAFSGVFMFVLAIVFAGKGVAALQEAGRIARSPVDLPGIGVLGIYPNVQGLALQGAMLVLALLLPFGNRMRRRVAYSHSDKPPQAHLRGH
jgi:high-affinity iron transporter